MEHFLLNVFIPARLILFCIFSSCVVLVGSFAASHVDTTRAMAKTSTSYQSQVQVPKTAPLLLTVARQVSPPLSAATPFNPNVLPRVNAEIYANNAELFIDPFIDVSTSSELISVPSKSADPNWPYSIFPWVSVKSPSPIPYPLNPYRFSSNSVPSLQRQPTTVSPCFQSSCAVRVTITSTQLIRWNIIKRAHRRLAQVIGFNSVFIPNSSSKVFSAGPKTFVVIIIFNEMYRKQIEPLITWVATLFI